MTKLAIIEDQTEEDKYDHLTTIKCWKCDPISGAEIPSSHPKATALIEGVMQSMSSARKSEVKAWEEELLPCEHTLTLHQSQGQGELAIAASGHAHCSSCVLTENLWLCLICGSLGCGRAQFGGIGGNGHGLLHYETTGHGVSVKLGTITPEGGAGEFSVVGYDCWLIILQIGRHILLYLQRQQTRPRSRYASFDVRHQRTDAKEDGKEHD